MSAFFIEMKWEGKGLFQQWLSACLIAVFLCFSHPLSHILIYPRKGYKPWPEQKGHSNILTQMSLGDMKACMYKHRILWLNTTFPVPNYADLFLINEKILYTRSRNACLRPTPDTKNIRHSVNVFSEPIPDIIPLCPMPPHKDKNMTVQSKEPGML